MSIDAQEIARAYVLQKRLAREKRNAGFACVLGFVCLCYLVIVTM